MRQDSGAILLTFTGFHDPYGQGPVEVSRQPGPILSLLGERTFARVYLLSTPAMVEETERTAAAVREVYSGTGFAVRHLDLPDPTDYGAILRESRGVIREVVESPFEEICVATASVMVREAAILSWGTRIDPEHLELLPRSGDGGIPEPHHGFSLEGYLSGTRRKLFERPLEIAEGNQAQAARLLGVTPAAVSKYVRSDSRDSL
jgi:hypothetical protein